MLSCSFPTLKRRFAFSAALLIIVESCLGQTRSPGPMNVMDHGPFVSSTISVDPRSPRGILAHKGIAVRVGAAKQGTIVFDTDLLRVAGAWSGGFLKWYPGRDGFQEFPSPDGFMHFETSQSPGWSMNGRFSDPRTWSYGPLPRKMANYKGLYVNDEAVVFSYSVGGNDILESYGYRELGSHSCFVRTINLRSVGERLSLQLLQAPDGKGSALKQVSLSKTSGYVEVENGTRVRTVGYRGLPEGAKWRLSERHLVLDLRGSPKQLDFELLIGDILSVSENGYMKADLLGGENSLDLSHLCEAGSARWERLKTPVITGTEEGPFVVDELSVPHENPWNSFLRFSGVDFLSDGRAVLSSFSGEVWVVDGLQTGETSLSWTRFATGLNQALGVKVVEDRVFVTGRDQITLLHDRNGDGEADFYENFNNEVMAATNFHAFTLNLDTDSKGNFYFAKATPWPPVSKSGVKAEVTPHHGVLFRMPPDGSRLDVIATGLRNPNGLSIGPNDEILYSDNEGNWVPTSKVHRIEEGGFHGFIPSAQRNEAQTDFVKPIMWLPHFVDNSPSTPFFIESAAWPSELQGQMLLTSYGRGSLSLVLKEEVEGQWQAAHLKLPLSFQSGTLEGRFHEDGHLYVAGLTSWQSVGHGGDWGSFHRVRYTGKPLHLPVSVNTKKGGLEMHFVEPLDEESALDISNYTIRQWTYPWSSQYGTRGKLYSARYPGQVGVDDVTIDSIQLSDDGKRVRLDISELRQSLVQRSVDRSAGLPQMIETPMGLVMAIEYQLKSADGVPLEQVIHKTIQRVPGEEVSTFPAPHVHSRETVVTHAPIGKDRKRIALPEGVDRVVAIKSTGIALSYDVTEIRAKVGERLGITFENASDMAHNLVIVKSESDVEVVGLAAIAAHENEFIPENEATRILAASRLAYPGDTVVIEFTASEPGAYPYICTFSGHFTMMQGRIIVEP